MRSYSKIVVPLKTALLSKRVYFSAFSIAYLCGNCKKNACPGVRGRRAQSSYQEREMVMTNMAIDTMLSTVAVSERMNGAVALPLV